MRTKKNQVKEDLSPAIPENSNEHMNFGKCKECMFVDFSRLPSNPNEWHKVNVYMHCSIYDETVKLTSCIRESEQEYERKMLKEEEDNCDFRHPVGFGKSIKSKE